MIIYKYQRGRYTTNQFWYYAHIYVVVFIIAIRLVYVALCFILGKLATAGTTAAPLSIATLPSEGAVCAVDQKSLQDMAGYIEISYCALQYTNIVI